MVMRACTREMLVRRGLLSRTSDSNHIKGLRLPPARAFLSHDAVSAQADLTVILLDHWALPQSLSSPSSTSTICRRLSLASRSQLGTSRLAPLVRLPPTTFLLVQELVAN